MDESFSALDVQTKHNLQNQVNRICQENNKTILFVTHDIDEAVYLSDEIIVLSKRPGTIQKIFEIKLEHPRNREDQEFKDFVYEITQEIAEFEEE